MARVADMTDASETMLRQAANWYAENDVPRAFRSLHPKVLRTVKRLCGGDWQRCVVNEDGSVSVLNRRVWQRTSE